MRRLHGNPTNPLLPLASPAPVNCGRLPAWRTDAPAKRCCALPCCAVMLTLLRHNPGAVQRSVSWVPGQQVNERLLPNTLFECFRSHALLAQLANSHTDNLILVQFAVHCTSTPAAVCSRTTSKPIQAWACVLDERQLAANPVTKTDLGIEDEQDASVPTTIIGSLQGSWKHDPTCPYTKMKTPCCLNHQKEMNRLVQTGATRVHHSAKHTTAHHKPRQALSTSTDFHQHLCLSLRSFLNSTSRRKFHSFFSLWGVFSWNFGGV